MIPLHMMKRKQVTSYDVNSVLHLKNQKFKYGDVFVLVNKRKKAC